MIFYFLCKLFSVFGLCFVFALVFCGLTDALIFVGAANFFFRNVVKNTVFEAISLLSEDQFLLIL